MTDPQTVISPKDKWTLLAVLHQSPQKEDGWSLAIGQWDEKKCLAIRWNGNKTNPKGNPCSHGMPTWFIVPDDLDDVLLSGVNIPADKRTLAKALLSH